MAPDQLAVPPILRVDVFVSSGSRITPEVVCPVTCTLIHGPTEAILVDIPSRREETENLIEWVKGILCGRPLKYIYITHGHGADCRGVTLLNTEWPRASVLATPTTISHIAREQYAEWRTEDGPVFTILPEPLVGDIWEIDYCALMVYQVGCCDTADATVVYVPELELVVAGGSVYGDVHQYFGEANTKAKRQEWLNAIDNVEALNARIVIAGHKRPGAVDASYYLDTTRMYIRDFEDAVREFDAPEDIARRMAELYPGRSNLGLVMAGAAASIEAKKLKM